jgi:hypothetical protein
MTVTPCLAVDSGHTDGTGQLGCPSVDLGTRIAEVRQLLCVRSN